MRAIARYLIKTGVLRAFGLVVVAVLVVSALQGFFLWVCLNSL